MEEPEISYSRNGDYVVVQSKATDGRLECRRLEIDDIRSASRSGWNYTGTTGVADVGRAVRVESGYSEHAWTFPAGHEQLAFEFYHWLTGVIQTVEPEPKAAERVEWPDVENAEAQIWEQRCAQLEEQLRAQQMTYDSRLAGLSKTVADQAAVGEVVKRYPDGVKGVLAELADLTAKQEREAADEAAKVEAVIAAAENRVPKWLRDFLTPGTYVVAPGVQAKEVYVQRVWPLTPEEETFMTRCAIGEWNSGS